MLIIAIIELPDTAPEALTGTYGDASDVIAEAILARLEDEPGYQDNGNPYGAAEVVVHAYVDAAASSPWLDRTRAALAAYSDATARGHGPL